MTPPRKARKLQSGLSLIALTIITLVSITLVTVTFSAASRYANRAGCIVSQHKLKKAIIAHANLMQKPLRKGVNYYSESNLKDFFEKKPTCPDSGGGYNVVLDPAGSDLIITCADHEHDHYE